MMSSVEESVELQRIYLSQYLKLQFSILSTTNICQAMRVRRNFMMLDAQRTSIAIRGTSGKVIIVYSSMEFRIEDDNVIPEKGIAREQSIHPRLPGSQLNNDMVGNGKSRPR
jgi:hypothetical protein